MDLAPIGKPIADGTVQPAGRRAIVGKTAGVSEGPQIRGRASYTIAVPVSRAGRVIYDLGLFLPAGTVTRLIARQRLPFNVAVTLVDTYGTILTPRAGVIAPAGENIPERLWETIRSRAEGLTRMSLPNGAPLALAFAHIAPFHWTVLTAASADAMLATPRAALLRMSGAAAVVLSIALLMALVAARGIIGPIERLGRLATLDHDLDAAGAGSSGDTGPTGLVETDRVAHVLAAAWRERRAVGQALAESESRFRALFEQSAGAALLLDPTTRRILDGNDAAATLLGLTREGLRGRSILDFVPRNSRAQLMNFYRSACKGTDFRHETRIVGGRGERDVLVAAARAWISGGPLILATAIDFTDLRKAEANLRANEERLELAREGANLGIWDWDLVSDTLTWNAHNWHLHGLAPSMAPPDCAIWKAALDPKDRARAAAEWHAAVQNPARAYRAEYSVQLPDGTVRRLIGRGRAFRGPDGSVVRMVGINMDVTARFEAEQARDQLIAMLKAERGRLADIIEALPVGVCIINRAGEVILANSVMQRLGAPQAQAAARACNGSDEVADEPMAGAVGWFGCKADGSLVTANECPVQRALRYGETTLPGREFIFGFGTEQASWYRVGSVPLRWEDGTVQEALGIYQNIDAKKRLIDMQHQINARLEQRVRQEMAAREAAQKRAAHAGRMHALGQIAGGIAHDFNNVLQTVSGGAALIERAPNDTERALRNARMILDAARRGAAITSRLLSFSRRSDLRAERIDAGVLLTDIAEILTHTLGGAVVCAVQVARDLPPLFADRGQLETVLVNLATNARDAMPSGGTLGMSADKDLVSAGLPHPGGLAPGQYVRIVVSDTGTGMDRAVLARVTEPFFTTKEQGKGTGLGLAMAKGFVEQSGGSLSIDSTVGEGTRVTLWLPVATDNALGRGEGMPAPGRTSDKPRALLVDDDSMVRDVLTLSLEDAGYAVIAADSGAGGLALLDAGEPVDILISDLTMPGMDGLTLVRAAQERRPKLPAILLTGYAGDGATLAVGGALSGSFTLLRKPISGPQLVDRASALLAARA